MCDPAKKKVSLHGPKEGNTSPFVSARERREERERSLLLAISLARGLGGGRHLPKAN